MPPSATGTHRKDTSPLEPCLGVLFVHGAGDHGTGSTLIEFGEALVAWLDGWLAQGAPSDGIAGEQAQVGATQILVREGDRRAPAHSYVRLEPRSPVGASAPATDHTWLLAESHWDDAFTPPGFQQVLVWAITIVPWVLITQFIGPLQRRARLVKQSPVGVFGYLWRVIVAVALSLVATGFVLVLTLITLVLSIVPIDALRGIVSKLQRFVERGVGDLYIVLSSPVQRAALTGAVQRDIRWLREQRCRKIALVAHSQGGFVAYQALTDPWHSDDVDLFLTFGSGLIRLTEADAERRNRGDLLLALIGTIGALVAIRFLPATILTFAGIVEPHQSESLFGMAGLLVSLALARVLWRYFHRKLPIADLPTPIPWIDFLTTEDPVMNRRRDGILPQRVVQVRVQNEGSLVADHGGYWKNTDEFVPQVALAIADLDPKLRLATDGPAPTPAKSKELLTRAYADRHGRVSALRLRGSVIVAATAAVIGYLVLRPGQLDGLGRSVADWFNGLPDFLTSWIPNFAEWLLPIQGIEMLVLGSLVIAGLAYLGIAIGSSLWAGWSAAATQDEFRGTSYPIEPQRGGPGAPFSRQATMFYGWALLQIAILVVIAVLGPLTILDLLRGYASQGDQIVEAWARQYVWTLVVGVVVGAIVWLRQPTRDAGWRVVTGIIVALLAELGIALVAPGPMDFAVGIALGFGAGVVSIVAVWLLWPILGRGLGSFRAVVERPDREPDTVYQCPANLYDYVGSIGLLIAVLALFLVFTLPPSLAIHVRQLWFFALLLGAVAVLCGLALALDKQPPNNPCRSEAVEPVAPAARAPAAPALAAPAPAVALSAVPPEAPGPPAPRPTRMQEIRSSPARARATLERNTNWGSPPIMRAVGAEAMLLGAVAAGVAAVRFIQA